MNIQLVIILHVVVCSNCCCSCSINRIASLQISLDNDEPKKDNDDPKEDIEEHREDLDSPENEESKPDSLKRKEKKEKSDSLKKSSGLKRMLPRMRSHDGIAGSNESDKGTMNKKLLTGSKSFVAKENQKPKLEQSDSFPNVKSLMNRMMFNNTGGENGKSKVTADKANKLPPSSKMKVTASKPEDILMSNSDGEYRKIKVTADKVNKLPPSSKMKITPTKPKEPLTDKKDDSN